MAHRSTCITTVPINQRTPALQCLHFVYFGAVADVAVFLVGDH